MITLYLGNTAQPREFEDDEIILLMPSSKSVGSIHYITGRTAYLVQVWNKFEFKMKYFYNRKCKKGDNEEYETKEDALIAAQEWFNVNNTNTYETVIEIEAKNIDENIAKLFFYKEKVIEYEEQDVELDPYFLGLWLGDGTSANNSICSIDNEIIEYITDYASKFNLSVINTEKRDRAGIYKIVGENTRDNYINSKLRLLNLIKNKHIPKCYLENTKEVRIKVLAGLIDTDGYLSRKTYEITQKNEKLSNDIVELAQSLGLFVYISDSWKRATNGKKLEKQLYYRIIIYTNSKIPVILPRKKNNGNYGYTIKISLNKVQKSFTHEWTDELKEKLIELLPKYTTKFGKFQWKKFTESEEEFADFSADSLRTVYRDLNIKTEEKEPIYADNIKEHFVRVAGLYKTFGGKIKWNVMMVNEKLFEGMTEQEMRTIISKLTKEELELIEQSRIVFEESIKDKLNEVIENYTNKRGGVNWNKMREENELLQEVDLPHMKNIFRCKAD